MKKVVLIPDSFKGTMSSSEICAILSQRLAAHYPGCQAVSIPVADGGEGTVDAFLEALSGERVTVKVKGPYQEEIDAFYGIIRGNTAVIEMAAAAGLPMVENRKNPAVTTTYGVGELILHAVQQRGCKQVIVGLGGSCTNDGGCGAAAALGVKFTDAQGQAFLPTGATLERIAKIDISAARENLAGCHITVMCDIDNPMYGETGAAYIFGPQKGADEAMVKELDRQLRCLSQAIIENLGRDVSALPGAGAAGAMGAGIVAFLGGELKQGIDTVLDTVGFEQIISDADLILTGEGKIDSQSIRGKVVIGIARRAKPAGVPVVAIVGDIGEGVEPAYELGVTAIFSINNVAVPFEKARLRSKQDLAATADNLFRLLSGMGVK